MAVALLGYGRFGRALGSLLTEASLPYRAFDPRADVPDGVRAASLAELVSGASEVVIAVPVPAIEAAARALRPYLTADHFVMDVGSVKVTPVDALTRTLGGFVPWAGTHPLFGPTSLSRAERPLRVVVCPNALHPGAHLRARAFYEQLGCEVLDQDPEAHDRAMASTHVLAFFVAKGLLDAGAGEDVPFAPPSFQAIARTLEAVRGDAGHLFSAIQHENPYAKEARRTLLAALSHIDTALAETPGTPGAIALDIPDLGARSPELRQARELIDDLDKDLVALLARRAQLATRAAKAKTELGAQIKDPARERALLEDRRAWAVAAGLDPDAVATVFDAVLRFSRKVQGGS